MQWTDKVLQLAGLNFEQCKKMAQNIKDQGHLTDLFLKISVLMGSLAG